MTYIERERYRRTWLTATTEQVDQQHRDLLQAVEMLANQVATAAKYGTAMCWKADDLADLTARASELRTILAERRSAARRAAGAAAGLGVPA